MERSPDGSVSINEKHSILLPITPGNNSVLEDVDGSRADKERSLLYVGSDCKLDCPVAVDDVNSWRTVRLAYPADQLRAPLVVRNTCVASKGRDAA